MFFFLILFLKRVDNRYMSLGIKLKFFLLITLLFLEGLQVAPFFPPLWASTDEDDCEKLNHPAYKETHQACLKSKIAIAAASAGVDCVDCFVDKTKESTNQWLDALAVVAEPIAFFGASYMVSRQSHKIQKAWANAYEKGHKECTNRFNNYLDYATTTGSNPITTAEAQALNMSCNGYSYSAYSGYGGLTSGLYGGSYNPFLQSGFSGAYINGYYGGSQTGMYNMNYMNGISSYGNPFASFYNPSLSGSAAMGLGVGSSGINVNSTGIFNSSSITPVSGY